MRTRLVRPEFWSDSKMADLAAGTRLVYIGLWCLADDDGYLRWELREIAAELFRYEDTEAREHAVGTHLDILVDEGRVKVLSCGIHAIIPTLHKYRVKGGNHTDQHRRSHATDCPVRTSTDKSLSVSVSVSDSVSESVSVPSAKDLLDRTWKTH